jgi:hypothetical protein
MKIIITKINPTTGIFTKTMLISFIANANNPPERPNANNRAYDNVSDKKLPVIIE